MIFSKQKIDQAFTYASKYYDKILSIDLTSDKFYPIKVNDFEWQRIKKKYSCFTEWVENFINSAYYKDGESNDIFLAFFSRLENLINIDRVMVCKYKKFINNEWHDVLFEFIPAEDNRAFIFVKDWTLMERGICNYEE